MQFDKTIRHQPEEKSVTQNLMKHILFAILGIVVVLSWSACSSEEEPQFRIRNERSDKANVQIRTSGGNTININDAQPGQTTAYQSASEGTIVATAVIQNESVSPTMMFFAAKDAHYTVVIQVGNTPSLRIE
jgi:hypothetical protein